MHRVYTCMLKNIVFEEFIATGYVCYFDAGQGLARCVIEDSTNGATSGP